MAGQLYILHWKINMQFICNAKCVVNLELEILKSVEELSI